MTSQFSCSLFFIFVLFISIIYVRLWIAFDWNYFLLEYYYFLLFKYLRFYLTCSIFLCPIIKSFHAYFPPLLHNYNNTYCVILLHLHTYSIQSHCCPNPYFEDNCICNLWLFVTKLRFLYKKKISHFSFLTLYKQFNWKKKNKTNKLPYLFINVE